MVSPFGRGFDSLQLHKNRSLAGPFFVELEGVGNLFLVHYVNGGFPGHLARGLARPNTNKLALGYEGTVVLVRVSMRTRPRSWKAAKRNGMERVYGVN